MTYRLSSVTKQRLCLADPAKSACAYRSSARHTAAITAQPAAFSGASTEFAPFSGAMRKVAGVPFSVMFNTSHGPLADIEVRKAAMMAVNRPRIAQNLFFGFAGPAYGPLSSTTPAYWKGVESYYPYDPKKAAELLDADGWKVGADGIRMKDGQPLSLHYIAMLEPDTAVALQAEWKKVGIDAQIDPVTKARQDELIMKNDYDIGEIRWVSNSPSILRIPLYSSNIPAPGKFKFNWMHIASPAIDKMIDDAGSAETMDQQTAIYGDLQKAVMDNAAFFAIHDQAQTIAYSSKIDGVKFAPGQWQVRFYDIHAAQ